MTEYASSETISAAQKGDKDAAEKLIEDNAGLIWSIARRYFGRGVEADDLYQLGCVGFLKAVQGYDASFGTQFSTYAVPKISGEIRRFLRDDGAVKVSRTIKERAAQVKNARTVLEQRLGRAPTVSELSLETGITPEDIATAEIATGTPESLQKEQTDDGFTLEQILCDRDSETRLIEHVALREAVSKLPEKERMVLTLRFWRGLTQDKAAKVLGVSQVQISRLERRAIQELRCQLT